MKTKYIAVVVIIVTCMMMAHGASLFTATFESGTEGWVDRDAGKMTVSLATQAGNPGNALQGKFNALAFGRPSANISDAMIVSGVSDSANLTGDYLSADARLLGFDFKCVNTLPVSLDVFLRGANGRTVHRSFHPMLKEQGIWQSFRVLLDSPDRGEWLGHMAQYDDILSSVTSVVIQISRNGESEQFYLVDNFFIDTLPETVAATTMTEGTVRLSWNNLRFGQRYNVEATIDLDASAWITVDSFIAGDSVAISEFSSTNTYRYFRLMMP